MKIVLFLFFFFIIFSQRTFAASVNLTVDRTELSNLSDELNVDVSLSIQAAENTTYYLRGVFLKQGTKNYCGYTWNGSSWFSGPYSTNEGWKNFSPVTISDNSWSGVLRAKLDTSDSGCSESGMYYFKVQRFTPSGSGVFDTQNDQIITVVLPTPTFTPTPSPKPTIAPTLTKAPKFTPYSQPTVTRIISILPLTKKTTIVPSITEPDTILSSSGAVWGVSTLSATPILSKQLLIPTTLEKNMKVQGISTIMIGSGVIILITSCGILTIQIIRKKIYEK